MSRSRTDEELLADRSDPAASIGELFDRYHREILGFCVRRTADVQVGADLASEVFAAAFVARRRFRSTGAGSARSWLYGIARRQLGHYVRREAVSNKYRHKLGMERTIVDDDAAPEIERLAEMVTLRSELHAALVTLPPGQLAAVKLRVIDELPYAEVARLLGCSQGAARVRVARGLSHLAEVMS